MKMYKKSLPCFWKVVETFYKTSVVFKLSYRLANGVLKFKYERPYQE